MKKIGKVLVVDDNQDVLIALNSQLSSHCSQVKVAMTPERAIDLCRKIQPDVVLMDMNFSRDAVSGEEGFVLLKELLRIDSTLPVVMMTAYSDEAKAVRAIKAGAVDFLPKPWKGEQLLGMLVSATRLRNAQNEVSQLKTLVKALGGAETVPIPEIVGESEVMRELLEQAELVGQTDANVLILGENGTGKDVLARYLYHVSSRRGRPFVNIDLGSLPESLFEGEMFGHERGAFTGAVEAKAGRLEAAAGGTLFLDEIGNLKPAMQAKLLTCIEKRQFSRLGSTRVNAIDVRFICATNTDLYRAVEEGKFRRDLLYRINTIELTVPPLRERTSDIPLLARHFALKFAQKYNKELNGFSAECVKHLKEYGWPGNVRELQNAVERAVILARKPMLRSVDFPLGTSCGQSDTTEVLDLETVERLTIERALARCDGNVTRAAKLLGVSRFSLYRKMDKMDL